MKEGVLCYSAVNSVDCLSVHGSNSNVMRNRFDGQPYLAEKTAYGLVWAWVRSHSSVLLHSCTCEQQAMCLHWCWNQDHSESMLRTTALQPPGWSEFDCQHCSANVLLWIDADWCWLGNKEQQLPVPGTDGLGCDAGCHKSAGNEHFSMLANGVSSAFTAKWLCGISSVQCLGNAQQYYLGTSDKADSAEHWLIVGFLDLQTNSVCRWFCEIQAQGSYIPRYPIHL